MAGFQITGTEADGDFTGKLRRFHVDSAHGGILGVGDLVKLTGTSHTDGVAEVNIATQGAAFAGVIASFEPTFAGEALSDTGLAVGVAGFCNVHVSQDTLFLVDCDETLSAVDVGLNADALVTAATKSGGMTTSNMEIDSSTKAATSTLHMRIVQLREDDDGVLGNRAVVRSNGLSSHTGTTGV